MIRDDFYEDNFPDDAFAEADDAPDRAARSGLREYSCQFCGETNEVFVDASGAAHQKFPEDCAVCCRPNLLTIDIAHDGTVFIEAEREYDA